MKRMNGHNIKMSITSAAIASVCMSATAAGAPDVMGTIIDQNGEPKEFVNVVLLNPIDSTFVQGATSDQDGKFTIITPETGGILKISSIGYETLYINTRDFHGPISIAMKEDNKMLDEITIKGQLPKTKLTGNSLVTAIQGSVLEKSGTAKEMLAKVPGMTQKGDDLEVLGKGTPIYYINGRKVNDKDELKRLRSEEISEVEVITNPGAQYDATVSAVVRIKTIRRQGNGFGYDIDLTNSNDLRFGYDDPNATLNLRYRHKNVDFFGMVNYWKWDNPSINELAQESYFLDGGKIHSIEQQSIMHSDWHGEGMNYNLGFNYQPTEKQSLGMRVEYHRPSFSQTDKFQTSVLTHRWADSDLTRTELNEARQLEDSETPYDWEGNAYYNAQFGKLSIDLNMDILTNKSTSKNGIAEKNDQQVALDNYSTTEESSNSLYAAKLVLGYPLAKGQLQAGSEVVFASRSSQYQAVGLALPQTDSRVEEKNVAAFVEYGCQLPRIGNLRAGVRYEHVGFVYTDRLDAANSLTRYTDDFFPSLSWSQQYGSWQTALSYGFKTIRPNYYVLNDAMQYLNSYTLKQGDSKLKNATQQEVSANVRWKYVNLFVAYERRDNTLTEWSYIYNDKGVILIKNINLENPVRNLAMFLSASPTWGCYSPNWTAGVQRFFDTRTLADPRVAAGKRDIKTRNPIAFFDMNNAFRLKHSWQLECNATIQTPGDVMNFHMASAIYRLNFVVQKCWLKNDALCLRASVNDVLQRSNQEMVMDCGYYQIHQRDTRSNHRLNVSLRYTFNAQQSKYKGSGAGKEAAGRMK